jgi:hypothetical protein
MRLFGNAIQQYYGELNISSPTGVSALLVNDSAGSVWGAATGGAQGANTINVAGGLFVNGVNVSAGGLTVLKAFTTTTASTTNNNTLTNDAVLTLALTTGKYYAVFMEVGFSDASGATGGGYRAALNYTGTGGSMGLGGTFGGSSGSAAVTTIGNVTSAFGLNSEVTVGPFATLALGATIQYMGTVFAGSAGGNLTVQWCQNSVNASTLIRQTGSSLMAIQLN